jgi:hypothetical protein
MMMGWTGTGWRPGPPEKWADGMCVNLGIGLPTLVPNFLDDEVELVLQPENGASRPGPRARRLASLGVMMHRYLFA